jgi:hypothetical protein
MRVVRGVAGADVVTAGLTALEAILAKGDGAFFLHALSLFLKLTVSSPDFSDNRDYKTLPNYQRKGSDTIWEQTELGTRQDVRSVLPSALFDRLRSSF